MGNLRMRLRVDLKLNNEEQSHVTLRDAKAQPSAARANCKHLLNIPVKGIPDHGQMSWAT